MKKELELKCTSGDGTTLRMFNTPAYPILRLYKSGWAQAAISLSPRDSYRLEQRLRSMRLRRKAGKK